MVQHIAYIRPYFAENGGPIIMTQIENELSGPSNTPYVTWLGQLAAQLDTGLPWIMCHGVSARGCRSLLPRSFPISTYRRAPTPTPPEITFP